jgi:hypothetical protein
MHIAASAPELSLDFFWDQPTEPALFPAMQHASSVGYGVQFAGLTTVAGSSDLWRN